MESIARSSLEERGAALTQELESGAKILADLEAKRSELEQTMLRISGALQLLDELLTPAQPSTEAEPEPTVRSVPA